MIFFELFFIVFNYSIPLNYFECLLTAYCEAHQIPVTQKNLYQRAISQDCRFKNARVMIETLGRVLSNCVFVESTSFFISS